MVFIRNVNNIDNINNIIELFNEDTDPVLKNIVKNIIEEPISKEIKARLLKPLLPLHVQFKLKAKKSDTNAYLPLTKKELAFFEDIPKS